MTDSPEEPEQPAGMTGGQTRNVVMIVSDDQATWGTGFGGNPEIITPATDALAGDGVVFENSYCTSPVCSPARSSLLTGMMPTQTGVFDWIASDNVSGRPYLRRGTTFTEVLSDVGFDCGISGKWHLGNSLRPQAGFEHWYVHQQDGGPYFGAPMVRNGETRIEPGYVTTAIADDAISFLERCDDERRFFLAVHFTAPHAPWVDQHPSDLLALYEDCEFVSCPQEPTHEWFNGYRSSHGEPAPVHPLMAAAARNPRPHLQGLFASITGMDREIGRILATLDRLGLRDTTLVVLTSDNGFNAGHHGIWGKGNGTHPQNMYDTSVKVPLVMSQPGVTTGGLVSDRLVSACDIRPTLMAALGVADPDGADLPGVSLVPDLTGSRSGGSAPGRPESVVVCDEYGPVRMIRTQQWKYVHRYADEAADGPTELYDLRDDPEERTNRTTDPSLADIVAEMKDRLEQWFAGLTDVTIEGNHLPVSGRGQLTPVSDTAPKFRRSDEEIPAY